MNSRWLAKVTYRADAGSVEVLHDIEELGEIEDLVEAGPHWDTIISIEIELQRPADGGMLTVEAAERL